MCNDTLSASGWRIAFKIHLYWFDVDFQPSRLLMNGQQEL